MTHKDTPPLNTPSSLFGLLLGVAVGTALGDALDDLAIGVSVGAGVGLLFAFSLRRRSGEDAAG